MTGSMAPDHVWPLAIPLLLASLHCMSLAQQCPPPDEPLATQECTSSPALSACYNPETHACNFKAFDIAVLAGLCSLEGAACSVDEDCCFGTHAGIDEGPVMVPCFDGRCGCTADSSSSPAGCPTYLDSSTGLFHLECYSPEWSECSYLGDAQQHSRLLGGLSAPCAQSDQCSGGLQCIRSVCGGNRSCDAPCGGELEVTAAFPDGGQITKAVMEEGMGVVGGLDASYGGGIALLDFNANDTAARFTISLPCESLLLHLLPGGPRATWPECAQQELLAAQNEVLLAFYAAQELPGAALAGANLTVTAFSSEGASAPASHDCTLRFAAEGLACPGGGSAPLPPDFSMAAELDPGQDPSLAELPPGLSSMPSMPGLATSPPPGQRPTQVPGLDFALPPPDPSHLISSSSEVLFLGNASNVAEATWVGLRGALLAGSQLQSSAALQAYGAAQVDSSWQANMDADNSTGPGPVLYTTTPTATHTAVTNWSSYLPFPLWRPGLGPGGQPAKPAYPKDGFWVPVSEAAGAQMLMQASPVVSSRLGELGGRQRQVQVTSSAMGQAQVEVTWLGEAASDAGMPLAGETDWFAWLAGAGGDRAGSSAPGGDSNLGLGQMVLGGPGSEAPAPGSGPENTSDWTSWLTDLADYSDYGDEELGLGDLGLESPPGSGGLDGVDGISDWASLLGGPGVPQLGASGRRLLLDASTCAKLKEYRDGCQANPLFPSVGDKYGPKDCKDYAAKFLKQHKALCDDWKEQCKQVLQQGEALIKEIVAHRLVGQPMKDAVLRHNSLLNQVCGNYKGTCRSKDLVNSCNKFKTWCQQASDTWRAPAAKGGCDKCFKDWDDVGWEYGHSSCGLTGGPCDPKHCNCNPKFCPPS